MNGGAGLERGYRRLLACYPRKFRDEHGEELLAVLLTSARGGQQRPSLIESADLVRNGLGMRLRPNVSRSARQGWSDALAVYSLAGPVLMLLSTAFTGALSRGLVGSVWPGVGVTLASQAVLVALVMAGRRKAALAALVPAIGLPWLAAAWIAWLMPGAILNVFTSVSICLLEAVALIASPGPRRGRRLMHWGHWAILLAAAAAALSYPFLTELGPGSLAIPAITLILILALNWLARALRMSRYFRLLVAATFYPIAFVIVILGLGSPPRWMNGIGYPAELALLFAGPLLCAAVALSTVIRPRRRRIV